MTDLLTHPRPGMEKNTNFSARKILAISFSAAIGCAAAGMIICMALALAAWFFAGAGVRGDTSDALASGVVVWLLGHGAAAQIPGQSATTIVSLIPMGLSALFAFTLFRFGLWAGRMSAPILVNSPSPRGGNSSLIFRAPTKTLEKGLAVAVGGFVAVYVASAVTAAALIPAAVARVSLLEVTLWTLILALLFGGGGVLAGLGQLQAWWSRIPGFVQVMVRGAVIGALLLVGFGSILVAVHLALNFNQIAAVVSGLGLKGGDLVMFALVNLVYAPNAIAYGIAYLAGPGFAVGTHTTVSLTQVDLGPVPALPWFASLPEPGVPPSALLALLVIPVVCGFVAALLAQRIYAVPALDSAALRGFGVGSGAAVLLAGFCWLAAGSLGDGRMAQIGPNGWEVLMAAGAALSLGGLVGGVSTAWWQRRGVS